MRTPSDRRDAPPPSLARRYRHLQRHDIAVLVLNAVSCSGAAALAVLQFADRTMWHWLGGAVVALTAIAAALEAAGRGTRERDARERETRRRLAESLIEDSFEAAVRLMSRRPDRTGGIVYLPDEAGVLHPTFLYNKDGAPADHPSFEKWVGCTGHAWGERSQRSADLSEATDEDLATTWKLSPALIRQTRHLQAIVSTPVWTTEPPRRLIGVVSIDSEVPDAESQLLTPESRRRAQSHAAAVALILELAELV